MNKITSKEFAEAMRLRNVYNYQQQLRNDIITAHRVAKKEKNREEQARLIAERDKLDKDILELTARIREAEDKAHEIAIEMAVKRTKMYVLSYCLQGAVFELNEYLKQHAQDDGGEVAFCEELRKCSDILMKMPIEFGSYGGEDNEAYNTCEEIISKEVDRGVRAAFDEMMKREIEKIK